MSEQARILLLGGSGLVGRAVIAQAVGREDLRLVALARREIPLPKGARMEVLLAQPKGWNDAIKAIAADHVICALGTTQKKQDGDQEAFRAVDHDLVLTLAEQAKLAGARSFSVISSVGASPQSANFYLTTKGEMEKSLSKLRYSRLDVFRPGLLKGAREQDPRLMETLGKLASPLVDLFLNAEKRKYRSIAASIVAAAALQSALEKTPGRFLHHHDEIMALAQKFAAHEEQD